MRSVRHLIGSVCILLLTACATGPSYSDQIPDPTTRPPERVDITPNDPRGVWLAARPSQCSSSDPWRKDWNNEQRYPKGEDEITVILGFFSKQGVAVIDSKMRYDPITACAACTCPGNYIAFVLVSEADAPTVASFRFRPERP